MFRLDKCEKENSIFSGGYCWCTNNWIEFIWNVSSGHSLETSQTNCSCCQCLATEMIDFVFRDEWFLCEQRLWGQRRTNWRLINHEQIRDFLLSAITDYLDTVLKLKYFQRICSFQKLKWRGATRMDQNKEAEWWTQSWNLEGMKWRLLNLDGMFL